jgi:hypothetical protein
MFNILIQIDKIDSIGDIARNRGKKVNPPPPDPSRRRPKGSRWFKTTVMRPRGAPTPATIDIAASPPAQFVPSWPLGVASGWSILPDGISIHWKAPPYHGAHPQRLSSANLFCTAKVL